MSVRGNRMTRIEPQNGKVNIEELPEPLQKQIREALDALPNKSKRHPVHGSRGDVLLGAAAVMGALHKSKVSPDVWQRILGQCQRWCRNPARLQEYTKEKH
jgi:hypothetical protein